MLGSDRGAARKGCPYRLAGPPPPRESPSERATARADDLDGSEGTGPTVGPRSRMQPGTEAIRLSRLEPSVPGGKCLFSNKRNQELRAMQIRRIACTAAVSAGVIWVVGGAVAQDRGPARNPSKDPLEPVQARAEIEAPVAEARALTPQK
jgi:hypothetical protein